MEWVSGTFILWPDHSVIFLISEKGGTAGTMNYSFHSKACLVHFVFFFGKLS